MQNQNTLLLVEDESVEAAARAKRLSAAGYLVTVVSSGEAAVESIQNRPEDFDLILMDIFLGDGIDGAEAARRILAVRDLPIVFLSARADPELIERTERIGSYGYVDKDTDEALLLASIRMALRLYKANSRLARSEKDYRQLFDNMIAGFASHRMI